MAKVSSAIKSSETTGTARAAKVVEMSTASIKRLDAASTYQTAAEQVGLYNVRAEKLGKPSWDETFVRVARLGAANDANHTFLAQEIFDAIPNCPFKRFQLAFCPPERMIVPRAALPFIEKGEAKNFKWAGMSVAGCLPSGEYVPEKLTADLQLAGDADSSSLQGFTKLKLIWDRLSTLRPDTHSAEKAKNSISDLRALRIGSAAESRNVLLEETSNLDDLVGTILWVQGTSGKKQTNPLGPRQVQDKVVQYYPSIYRAHRRTAHEATSYDNENDVNSDLKSTYATTGANVDTLWRKPVTPALTDLLRGQVKAASIATVEALSMARDPHKVDTLARVVGVSDVTDARGRTNPSVTVNALTVSERNLQKRGLAISGITSSNNRDRSHIRDLVRGHERIFRKLHEQILSNRSILNENQPLFGIEILKPGVVDAEVKLVRTTLGLSSEMLNRIKVRPFTTFGNELAKSFDEFEATLRDQRSDPADRLVSARKVLSEIEMTLRIYQALRLVERICELAAHESPPALSEVSQKNDQVLAMFQKAPLFSAKIRPGLAEVRDVVVIECARIRDEDLKDTGAEDTVEERRRQLEQLKASVENFDVEQLFKLRART